jgi:rare lipoprotein A
MHALTAAHRTLSLGTVARITNVVNGRHVMIQINDLKRWSVHGMAAQAQY